MKFQTTKKKELLNKVNNYGLVVKLRSRVWQMILMIFAVRLG